MEKSKNTLDGLGKEHGQLQMNLEKVSVDFERLIVVEEEMPLWQLFNGGSTARARQSRIWFMQQAAL